MSGWTQEQRDAQSAALKKAWRRRKKAARLGRDAKNGNGMPRPATVPEQAALMHARELLSSVNGDAAAAKAAIDQMLEPGWKVVAWETIS